MINFIIGFVCGIVFGIPLLYIILEKLFGAGADLSTDELASDMFIMCGYNANKLKEVGDRIKDKASLYGA